MLINLVKNALKFSVHKGFIRIYASYDKQQCELKVKVEDNGIGIDHRDHDSLFKMFGSMQRTSV